MHGRAPSYGEQLVVGFGVKFLADWPLRETPRAPWLLYSRYGAWSVTDGLSQLASDREALDEARLRRVRAVLLHQHVERITLDRDPQVLGCRFANGAELRLAPAADVATDEAAWALEEFLEHLGRFRTALERLHAEVYHAAQAEKVNLPPPHGLDIEAGLRPWREWSATSLGFILGAGWNQPPKGTEVFMDLAAVRNLARSLDYDAEDIETIGRDLATGLDPVGIAPPPFLTFLGGAAGALGGEIRRRAGRMEEADRQVAAQASALAASLLAPASGVVSRFSDAVRSIAAAVVERRRIANDPKAPLAERSEANHGVIRYEVQRLEQRRKQNIERIAKYGRELLFVNPQAATTRIGWLQRANLRLERKIERFEGWADDPTRHFLMFDPEGDGRVAEVFGDLGGAANVAVIVPGMNNEMANFDGALRASGQNLAGTAGPPRPLSPGWATTRPRASTVPSASSGTPRPGA